MYLGNKVIAGGSSGVSITSLKDLDVDALIKIITEPKNASKLMKRTKETTVNNKFATVDVNANKTNITNNNGELVSSNTTTTNELNSYIATLKETTGPVATTSGDDIKFKIAAKASSAIANGEYNNVINFAAVVNPTP